MKENQDAEILAFLPHRPPMLLVKRLIKATFEEIEAEFDITAHCIFLRPDNSLEESACIEILAQCFAAGRGFLNQDKILEWGYLAAISGFKIHGKAFLGDTIRAMVRPIARIERIIVLEGELYCKKEMIVSGQFKIYVPDDMNSEE